MSGYGTNKWTCGRCGDTYETDGVVGDLVLMRWRREHLEEHRVADMTPEERHEHYRRQAQAFASFCTRRLPPDP